MTGLFTTTHHKKHTGHRVMKIDAHVWFCFVCLEQFDPEPATVSEPPKPESSIAQSPERQL